MDKLNFEEKLNKWGREHRGLSPNNDRIKSEILSKFSSMPKTEYKSAMPTRIPWLSVAFAGMALVVFVVSPLASKKPMPVIPMLESSSPAVNSVQNTAVDDSRLENQNKRLAPAGAGQGVAPANYAEDNGNLWKTTPPIDNSVPANDTREFLKTYYGAEIKSRDPQGLTGQIQMVIKGFGGRVDLVSSREKSGYISFVIPADKFESFRNQVKNLVWAKLYVENETTQNLLPQKINIETRWNRANESLTRLTTDLNNLKANHQRIVNQVQTRRNAIANELNYLRGIYTNDSAYRAEIDARIQQLVSEDNQLAINLANENRTYQSNLAELNNSIGRLKADLNNIHQEETNLLDNVATVNGTISISWISIWAIMELYVPGSLIAWLFVLAAVLSLIWYYRRPRPLVI